MAAGEANVQVAPETFAVTSKRNRAAAHLNPALFSLADIVNCDLKSTLRVLYNLFTRYRNVD